MGFTPEQKKAWYKQYAQNRAARRKAYTDSMVNAYQAKQSHDWDGEWVKHNNIGSAKTFQKTNCKKCGINYMVFKMNPQNCKAEEAEETEENK